jgi:single-stranded DNA-binding protein
MEQIHVYGIGRLTKDVQANKEKGGNFTIAIDIGYGEKQQTDFWKCFVSQETMEHMLNAKVKKGSLIQIIGTPRYTSKVEKEEGKTTYENNGWINVSDWGYPPSNGGSKKDAKEDSGEKESPAPQAPPAGTSGGKAPDFSDYVPKDAAESDDEPY